MTELHITGPTAKVKAVLDLIEPHTVVNTWQRDDEVHDLNIKVHDDLVDDVYEACDQAGVKVGLV